MTLPCGHTTDEHTQTRIAQDAEFRDRFTSWVRDAAALDSSGWPDALIEMADMMAIGTVDAESLATWTRRAHAWSDDLLVQLTAMSATALISAHIGVSVMLKESVRLDVIPAATTMHFLMARQVGNDSLDDVVAFMIADLGPVERFMAVHFGASALKTIGMSAADLLDLVETVTPSADLD